MIPKEIQEVLDSEAELGVIPPEEYCRASAYLNLAAYIVKK